MIFIRLMMCLFLLVISGRIQSQVVVNEDPNVEKVIRWYKNLRAAQDEIEGWAVQIISTRDRRKIEEARSKFRYRYPQHKMVTDYEEPFYRLRVGSFISKLDALSLRNEVRSEFRSSLLIQQNFRKSDFY